MTLGKLPSLSEPLFPLLHSKDNNMASCRMNSAQCWAPWFSGLTKRSCFVTILDSVGLPFGFKLVQYFPEKIVVP